MIAKRVFTRKVRSAWPVGRLYQLRFITFVFLVLHPGFARAQHQEKKIRGRLRRPRTPQCASISADLVLEALSHRHEQQVSLRRRSG